MVGCIDKLPMIIWMSSGRAQDDDEFRHQSCQEMGYAPILANAAISIYHFTGFTWLNFDSTFVGLRKLEIFWQVRWRILFQWLGSRNSLDLRRPSKLLYWTYFDRIVCRISLRPSVLSLDCTEERRFRKKSILDLCIISNVHDEHGNDCWKFEA